MKEQVAAGERVLAYVDESGFAAIHPNRSAWTPKGERHLIDAKRGKRLNVMAALITTGEVFAAKFWESTTAGIFAGFLGLLTEHVKKPFTIILDNASVHTSKEVLPVRKLLEDRGVTFYFLPPYSPELNRIELLWHKIKHTWMAVKNRTSEELEDDVNDIFAGFGKKYIFNV
jgi:transposase